MTRHSSAQDLDFDLGGEEGGRFGPGPADWALFLLRAPGRRKLLFTAVLVASVAAVFAYYRLKPPTYRVEAKILAQQQEVVPASFRSTADDSALRTAWEVIHRRDNLLALIKAGKLLEGPPPGEVARFQNGGARLLQRGDRDPLDEMVVLLDKRLVVSTEQGTITIALDWPDPEQAYAVVDAALQNFIEARHVQEVTAIDEVLSVLRVRAANAKDQLERVTDEVRRESIETARDARQASTQSPTPQPAPSPAPRVSSDELIRLKSLLESKDRAIADVEEFRRRRLADLHAQLDEKRTTYSEAHPSIIQLRQDIDALSRPSPQVVSLQEEAATLRLQYQARLEKDAREATASGSGAASSSAVQRSVPRPQRSASTPLEEDERVRDARSQYQQINDRVNAAQLELDAVRAAFKYRYNVVWPPQIPREPISPNPVKTLGIGLVAAFLFAIGMAALPDLSTGRIVERWQVERGLGITVLAEIKKK